MQDFRLLTDWGHEPYVEGKFRQATELQRPEPWQPVEKNWFIFWDIEGKMYAHYDIAPKRVFAELQFDGSAGPDLAPNAALVDDQCMERYMPGVGPELESLHQATNSLSVTLCRRSDTSCQPNGSNTFIFTIFQHKTFYAFHSVYEPYIMLFNQQAPFQIHAISRKPLWIHGRGRPGEVIPYAMSDKDAREWDQTEMFYVTSISWKTYGKRYHGYIDDPLFIAFGIEDTSSGGIEILAGDLMAELGLCGPPERSGRWKHIAQSNRKHVEPTASHCGLLVQVRREPATAYRRQLELTIYVSMLVLLLEVCYKLPQSH